MEHTRRGRTALAITILVCAVILAGCTAIPGTTAPVIPSTTRGTTDLNPGAAAAEMQGGGT